MTMKIKQTRTAHVALLKMKKENLNHDRQSFAESKYNFQENIRFTDTFRAPSSFISRCHYATIVIALFRIVSVPRFVSATVKIFIHEVAIHETVFSIIHIHTHIHRERKKERDTHQHIFGASKWCERETFPFFFWFRFVLSLCILYYFSSLWR